MSKLPRSTDSVKALIADAERRAAELGVPVLAGMREISVDLGVARQTASMWPDRRATNGFPEEIVTLSMGPIYSLDDVRKWYRDRELRKVA